MDIAGSIRNYTFVPTGEMIRAVEVTIATVAIEAAAKLDFSKPIDWRAWAHGVAIAVVIELIAYGKGKLPPSVPPSP